MGEGIQEAERVCQSSSPRARGKAFAASVVIDVASATLRARGLIAAKAIPLGYHLTPQ